MASPGGSTVSSACSTAPPHGSAASPCASTPAPGNSRGAPLGSESSADVSTGGFYLGCVIGSKPFTGASNGAYLANTGANDAGNIEDNPSNPDVFPDAATMIVTALRG